MKLDPRARAAGARLVAHETLGSTNAEALALARQGERGPLWITARQQTAGRGRRGRTWESQPGNLHASLLLTNPAAPRHWPELSFVAALALHDAVVEIAPELKLRLALKWPNDLLLSGRKTAGILIECETNAAAVVVGIGVNCASHPAQTDHPATDLIAGGAAITPDVLLKALSAKMLVRLVQWNGGAGFASVRADWLAHAAGLGDEIRVRFSDREITGCFETLDRVGNLVVRRVDGGVETIPAGDIFIKRIAAPEREIDRSA